ncbi:unnamed protein product [Pedinophyceae sp. YPF-701]|nr:unnamed protein product [Pedinophyceae sp. YPF-701]
MSGAGGAAPRRRSEDEKDAQTVKKYLDIKAAVREKQAKDQRRMDKEKKAKSQSDRLQSLGSAFSGLATAKTKEIEKLKQSEAARQLLKAKTTTRHQLDGQGRELITIGGRTAPVDRHMEVASASTSDLRLLFRAMKRAGTAHLTLKGCCDPKVDAQDSIGVLSDWLQLLPDLKKLEVISSYLSFKELKPLAGALAQIDNVTLLNLSMNPLGGDGASELAHALMSNDQCKLAELRLDACDIDDKGGTELGNFVKGNKTLEKLFISENKIGPIGCTCIAEGAAGHPKLAVIDISRNAIRTRGVNAFAKPLLAGAPLQKLSLADNQADGDCREFGEAVGQSTRLRTLKVSTNPIGDSLLVGLGDNMGKDTALEYLDAGANEVSDYAIQYLTRGLQKNSTVNYINLSGNRLSDQSGIYFGKALQENSSLATLLLAYNAIMDDGLEALIQGLKGNKSLKMLDLSANIIRTSRPLGKLATVLSEEDESLQPGLETIYLRESAIQDEMLKPVAMSLGTNKALKVLDVQDNELNFFPVRKADAHRVIGLDKQKRHAKR